MRPAATLRRHLAGVAELADAADSKSAAPERLAGSIPVTGIPARDLRQLAANPEAAARIPVPIR